MPSTVPAVSKIRDCRWVPSFPDQGSLAIKAFGAVNISTARVLDSMAKGKETISRIRKSAPSSWKMQSNNTDPTNRESPATMYVIFTYPKNYPSSVGVFFNHSQSFGRLWGTPIGSPIIPILQPVAGLHWAPRWPSRFFEYPLRNGWYLGGIGERSHDSTLRWPSKVSHKFGGWAPR